MSGNNTAVSSLSSVKTGLSEEAQQQLLKRVMERRDFLLDIDCSTASLDVVMMCNEAVEQGKGPGTLLYINSVLRHDYLYFIL